MRAGGVTLRIALVVTLQYGASHGVRAGRVSASRVPPDSCDLPSIDSRRLMRPTVVRNIAVIATQHNANLTCDRRTSSGYVRGRFAR